MYVIVTRRGITIDHYPAVKRHLQQFRRRLEPKPASWTSKGGIWPGRAPGEYKWYELQASPSDEFVTAVERPKIVYQEIQFHSWFALDTSGSYPNNKAFFLPTDELWILAILNSPLMWWVLTRILPHMKDEALSPVGFIMENLRVPLPSGVLRDKITTLAGGLCRLTDKKYAEQDRFLDSLASLNGGGRDRRALNWLTPCQRTTSPRSLRDQTVHLYQRGQNAKLYVLKSTSGEALDNLQQEQLRLEEELATLVKDVYDLSDQGARTPALNPARARSAEGA